MCRSCFVGRMRCFENVTIDVESDVAKEGLCSVSIGRMEDPLLEVSILVLCWLTKQPINAPWDLICSLRKLKSGR